MNRARSLIFLTRVLILTALFLLYINTFCGAGDFPRVPSWYEHVDLMTMAIWGLSLLVLYFIARILRQVDKSQCELFERMEKIERDFYTLKGEHLAISGRCRT